jgi:hypothetical protein
MTTMNITTGTKDPRRHPKKRTSATAPSVKHFQDIDTDRLYQSLVKLFHTWIPKTLDIFGTTGTSRYFWSSQIQYELDHRLWHKDFLGREATDEERDWLVESAMRVHWPRIQKALARLRANVTYTDMTANLRNGKDRRKTKLRRALTLEEVMGRMNIGEECEMEEGDDEVSKAAPDLTVWEICDNTSLERELKKVEQDEKLCWMRSGKDVFGLKVVLDQEDERDAVESRTAQESLY